MSEVRFYLDEHINRAVAKGLRRQGIVAITPQDRGRRGFADITQLRLATAEGLVMVTLDADYLSLAADFVARGEFHAGIVFGVAQSFETRPGLFIRELATVAGVLTAEDLHNHVEYL